MSVVERKGTIDIGDLSRKPPEVAAVVEASALRVKVNSLPGRIYGRMVNVRCCRRAARRGRSSSPGHCRDMDDTRAVFVDLLCIRHGFQNP
jgi:hypothetical protein